MENKKKYNLLFFIVAFFEAALIGVGGILPGISGGILCVIFGFYRPLVETLSDPLHKLVPNLKHIIPLALGSAFGFLGLAKLISGVMEKNSALSICVFVGLIIGTLPDMWKDAGKEKRGAGSWIALAVTTIMFLSFFTYLEYGAEINITPNIFWYFFIGIIWGISIVVPGLSSSSTLMFLGLYQPMVDALADIDVVALIPILVGIVTAIVALSKLVAMIYLKHHSVASHIIIGIVLATTIPLIPRAIRDSGNIPLAIVCLAIGAAAAVAIGIICPKIAAMVEKE